VCLSQPYLVISLRSRIKNMERKQVHRKIRGMLVITETTVKSYVKPGKP
jgi:hypothetical protein